MKDSRWMSLMRSRATVACLLVGVLFSYALCCGMAVWRTPWVRERRWLGGTGAPEWLDGVEQPWISITHDDRRVALRWSSRWFFDSITAELLPDRDWSEYGERAYPWPEQVRAKGLPVRAVPPYWSDMPRLGSDEAIVHSQAFGWPFRAANWQTRVVRDPATGLIVDLPLLESRGDEVWEALSLRPVLPGLFADALVWGAPV